MNKHLLILLALLYQGSTPLYAQDPSGKSNADVTSGVIEYEHKVNLHRRLAGENEAMRAMVPEYRVSTFQLSYNGQLSLYKPVLEYEPEEMGSGGVRIQMRQPYSEIFTDASTRAVVQFREFLGKNYLIEDALTIQPWKMGEEIREINGYTCRIAWYTDTTTNNEVTAWYTTDLPPYIGPERFNTLPGTVLAVDINNGERVIVAKNIAFRQLKKNELKRPEKGTKVTATEYEAMVEEQMEQMRQHGGRVIRD